MQGYCSVLHSTTSTDEQLFKYSSLSLKVTPLSLISSFILFSLLWISMLLFATVNNNYHNSYINIPCYNQNIRRKYLPISVIWIVLNMTSTTKTKQSLILIRNGRFLGIMKFKPLYNYIYDFLQQSKFFLKTIIND